MTSACSHIANAEDPCCQQALFPVTMGWESQWALMEARRDGEGNIGNRKELGNKSKKSLWRAREVSTV